ncbi:hypothetical protein CLUG_05703 [Clavispora lusitaniae ATCC 42720]|uniref:Amino acid permease/ SLC12A domain-containing protein n=1 Tax=Clavispora lusitaniae (strain ATCC 42720) TaxID=306902 RepID=C4YBX5_CLAL4|nr:uncharacterized protein CLUG_05703 [Clavispora lusitaniae ATCC 42720]EEQ41575.1 hypothetical protein CLUG_05703 [Clavispora lusitaniae ATCC 42720]
MLVFGLILTGLIIDLGGVPGQERLGFRYWKDGAFNWLYFDSSTGRFIAFWKTMVSTVYSYGGVQGIAMLAGEVEYPRRAIHRAAKRVFRSLFPHVHVHSLCFDFGCVVQRPYHCVSHRKCCRLAFCCCYEEGRNQSFTSYHQRCCFNICFVCNKFGSSSIFQSLICLGKHGTSAKVLLENE